ncbi:SAV_2336 N-terminal domain-related protein [Streptomyces sp. NBC_01508]|uniref:SAV_2336 N-terminal domain-related protein n=1 Tax=Streptomyces sp. NBC_01508 TaxID=2903888 RepID=UPI003867A439
MTTPGPPPGDTPRPPPGDQGHPDHRTEHPSAGRPGDPSGGPPPGRSDGSHRLAELVGRLRAAGREVSARELAEALWLARLTAPPPRTGDRPEHHAPPTARPAFPETALQPPAEATVPPPRPDPAPRSAEHTAPLSLYAPSGSDAVPTRSFPIRAPATGALSGLPGLQRALRPLRGYRPPVPPVLGTGLDEEATAERSAADGFLRPVRRPAAHREAEIQLLMDASSTASVWQPTLERLRQACERLGAFRDVQVHYLHQGPDGSAMAGTGPDPHHTRLRPADQHRDVTGRRLTLVISDCVGPLWQSGGAQRMLYRWAAVSQIAVVQPLPPRLWDRTALPADPGLLVHEPGVGRGTRFVADETHGRAAPPAGALPVPVLLPTDRVLGGWAQLLGGTGTRTMRGAAGWVLPRHPARPDSGPYGGARTPQARLRDFRSGASPGALELAVHLAAVPLYLPVMQLVQEALLPDTGPMQLAEVLLGGLLERLPDAAGVPGPRYDFAPGVRELLLEMLDQGAAELVLKYLSEYVTRRFGKGMRNFPALAVARLQGLEAGEPVVPEDPDGGPQADEELFAQVPARVVRWYRPVRPVPGRLDEVERLLGLWRDRRDRQMLFDAQALAEASLAADGDGRSRHLLGRVLFARANTAQARRDPEEAHGLLTRAERLLTGHEPATAVARADVRHELWRQDGDPQWLRAAVAGLAEMPEGADLATRTARGLRMGRVLLDLARTDAEPQESATASVRELRAALGLLDELDAPPHRRAGALLDLVAALRLTREHDTAEVLALTEAAEAAAEDSAPLLLRARRERARIHRAARDWEAAATAYRQAERSAPLDSDVRCELLAEWGEMLLTEARHPDRAEGILREAVTNVSSRTPLRWRLHLLLGTALLDRYRGDRTDGGFLPDVYEGCHLLELSARRAADDSTRARSWLTLAGARLELPDPQAHFASAESAYGRALREITGPPSLTAARALHGRGELYERMSRPSAALADYRAAATHWDGLAERGTPAPEAETRATRERTAALLGSR